MATQIINKGTFYSTVTIPDFKGLLEESIDVKYDCKRKGQLFEVSIDVWYVMKEFNGIKRFEVLKSQTQFDFLTNGSYDTDDLYKAVKDAIIGLKSFPDAKANNIENQLQQIPILTKAQVQHDLELTVRLCHQNPNQ